MKVTFRKILSLICVMAMILCWNPSVVRAQETQGTEQVLDEDAAQKVAEEEAARKAAEEEAERIKAEEEEAAKKAAEEEEARKAEEEAARKAEEEEAARKAEEEAAKKKKEEEEAAQKAAEEEAARKAEEEAARKKKEKEEAERKAEEEAAKKKKEEEAEKKAAEEEAARKQKEEEEAAKKAEEERKAGEEAEANGEIQPDQTMKIGEEVRFSMQSEAGYIIRLTGEDGDIQIDAEADFVLSLEITDESNDTKKTYTGKEEESFQVVFGCHSGRTYLLTFSAKNSYDSGMVIVKVNRKPTEQPAASENQPDGEQEDKGQEAEQKEPVPSESTQGTSADNAETPESGEGIQPPAEPEAEEGAQPEETVTESGEEQADKPNDEDNGELKDGEQGEDNQKDGEQEDTASDLPENPEEISEEESLNLETIELPPLLISRVDDPDNPKQVDESEIEANGFAAPKPSAGYYPSKSSSKLYISWTDAVINISKANKYEVYRRENGGAWSYRTTITSPISKYNAVGNNKGTFIISDSITTGNIYEYQIWLYNSAGTLASKSKTSGAAAMRMSTMSATKGSDGYWTLKWSQVNKADGYYIFRKLSTDDNFSSKPYKTIDNPAKLSFKDKSVKNGKTYEYVMIPFRTLNGTRFAGTYNNMLSCYIGVEKIPTINGSSQKNASVTIQWSAATDANVTGYEIYVKKGGAGKWSKAGTVGKDKTSFTHKLAVTCDTSGRKDQYKVRAIGRVGDTEVRGKFSAVREQYRIASPGTVVLKKGSAEDTATVKWDAVKGAEKYYVYYRVSSASAYSCAPVNGSSTNTTIKVVGAQENDIYVTAYGQGITSQKTATKHITPYWYYVLLVGEPNYYDGNSNLYGPKYDAYALAKVFKKQTQTNNVTTLINASANTIKSYISSTFGSAGPNSVCIFMFSGHGKTGYDSSTTGALCCSDGSNITPATLKQWMSSLKSKHIVIMLSSCGSGAFIQRNGKETEQEWDAAAFNHSFINTFMSYESNANEFSGSTKYSVMTAAQAHQNGKGMSFKNPYTGAVFNGYSYIMLYLSRAGGYDYCDSHGNVGGWIGKQGDKNKDNKISLQEAYSYAKPKVRKNGNSEMAFWSSEPSLILFQ